MIISHKHRFIFVKTAKTAGTSIEVFLSTMCGREDVLTPHAVKEEGYEPRNFRGTFNPLPELVYAARVFGGLRLRSIKSWLKRSHYFHHMPAWLIRERVGAPAWETYYTFCVERNPWDKVVSGYRYYQWKRGVRISMGEYLDLLEKRSRDRFSNGVGEFPLNLGQYTDPRSGNIMVDRVLAYERLDDQLGEVMESLGLPYSGRLMPRAKQLDENAPVRVRLSGDEVQRIAVLHAEEIALFGYSAPTVTE